MKIEDRIVIETNPLEKTITTISTNARELLPFNIQKWDLPELPAPGNLLRYEDGKFTQQQDYKTHHYDIVDVQGVYEAANLIVVYGPKIGEQVFSMTNKYAETSAWSIKRDDELLIKATDTHTIIHNINQAYKRFNLRQRYQR